MTEPERVPMAARDIALSAADLQQAVRETQTFDEAMRIWQLARELESALGAVASAALEKAEALIQ